VGSGLQCLKEYVVNLSRFEEGSKIDESDGVRNEIYHRVEDQFLIFVKSVELSESVQKSRMESELENLINLRHPCIAGPIGFIFGIESDSRQELKIVRLYSEGCSLAEVFSIRPVWWTSTVKAKVVAGIVLGLQFAHSLGLVHGNLTASNILFDSDHCIQIVDFKPLGLAVQKSEDEGEKMTKFGEVSRQRWTPQTDISSFASILFEIVGGQPTSGESSVPTTIPSFVSEIIETGLWSTRRCSFQDIMKILKEKNFQIEDGVGAANVFALINWLESREQSEK
jgi:serine/threonine protein kinase